MGCRLWQQKFQENMGDRMKRFVTILLGAFLIAASIMGDACQKAAAAGNRRIYNAYAEALSSGKIEFEDKYSYYALKDVNGDGREELCIVAYNCFYVWKYKNGKVVLHFKYNAVDPIQSIHYDKEKAMYWLHGEGDGGWYTGLKKKGRKLVERVQYYIGWKAQNKNYATKTTGGRTVKISVGKYQEIARGIEKKECIPIRAVTKRKLLARLALLERSDKRSEKANKFFWKKPACEVFIPFTGETADCLSVGKYTYYSSNNGKKLIRKDKSGVERVVFKANGGFSLYAIEVYGKRILHSLTLRSGHGTGYPAIVSIPKGSRVYVSRADGGWAYVEWLQRLLQHGVFN